MGLASQSSRLASSRFVIRTYCICMNKLPPTYAIERARTHVSILCMSSILIHICDPLSCAVALNVLNINIYAILILICFGIYTICTLP